MTPLRFTCPCCKTPAAMSEICLRREPFLFRMVCGVCQHPVDGPRDYEETAARTGLRAVYKRQMDNQAKPLKYDNRGII